MGAAPRGFAQQPPPAVDAATPDVAGAAPAAPPEPPPGASPSRGGWRVPPILTYGSLAYDLRLGRGPGTARSTEHLVTGSINGTTYLYQPWFARLTGGLGLTLARSRFTSDEAAGPGNDGSNDQFITGNLRLDLFPRSRFPFEVHYEVNDSRIDTGAPSTFDYRSRTFGVSQKYRPLNGSYNVNLSAERRIFDTAGSHDTLDALLGDFSTQWKSHQLSLGGSSSSGERGATGETSRFSSLVGRHHFSPASGLSVDSTLNWSNTEDRLENLANDFSLAQWSSVGIWHPDGRPWTLTGSLRALSLEDNISGFSTQNAGATLGGTYEVNQNLRLTAGGSVNVVRSDDATSTSTLGSAGATYQGDSIDLGGFRYDWFGGGALSVSKAEEQQDTTLSTQAGHTLSRAWPIAAEQTLGVNFGQSVSASHTVQDPPSEVPGLEPTTKLLVHNAALSWSHNGAERSGYARASFSDSREIGGTHARFQLVNLQASGTLQFDRNQSLNGDLTLQWSSQRSGDTFDLDLDGVVPGTSTRNQSRGGEISYRHSRFFDVPRLRFTSRLRMAQDVQEQPGALVLLPDRETRLWENRLDWNIGRLETQLVLRISWVDGQRRDLLMWRFQRAFGN